MNTTGFKKDRAAFATLAYQVVTAPGAASTQETQYATGLNLGTGVLETGDGFPVMGSGGPITVPPAQDVRIAADGTLSIMALGAAPGSAAQVIDRIRLSDPQGSPTVKGLDNLLHVKGGGVLPDDLDATVISGSLEGSNVNLTQALVDMIENQRSYEVQANLLKEAKSMDESSASLMRLPG